jgi:murein DD-endopeptidase MepM/ murein hydrolase activator NlpD
VRLIALLLAPLWLGALFWPSWTAGLDPSPGAEEREQAVRPVTGAVVRPFAPPATAYGPGHRGVDLSANPGEPVRSVLPGVVTFAGPVAGRGWVTVDHGGIDTTYGWIDPIFVTPGEGVRAGQVLGVLAAEASHLDWGARSDGRYLDPLSLLGRWEARLVPLGGE